MLWWLIPRRYHRAPILRGKWTCVSPFLLAWTLVTYVLFVLAGIYRLPRLVSSCTVCSHVTCKGFPFACKSTKNAWSWLCARRTCIFTHGYSAHECQVQIELYRILIHILIHIHRDGRYGIFQKLYGIWKNTSVSLNIFYACNQLQVLMFNHLKTRCCVNFLHM